MSIKFYNICKYVLRAFWNKCFIFHQQQSAELDISSWMIQNIFVQYTQYNAIFTIFFTKPYKCSDILDFCEVKTIHVDQSVWVEIKKNLWFIVDEFDFVTWSKLECAQLYSTLSFTGLKSIVLKLHTSTSKKVTKLMLILQYGVGNAGWVAKQ